MTGETGEASLSVPARSRHGPDLIVRNSCTACSARHFASPSAVGLVAMVSLWS